MSNKKSFYSLDIAKFVMAFLILMAHICSENIIVDSRIKLVTSLYNFAVPFFFACSGFLFFYKHHEIVDYKRFCVRLLRMYFVWSLIYFFFVLFDWIKISASFDVIIRYIHIALVFTTYGTIWFLPSLLIGMTLTFFLIRKLSIFYVNIIGLLFYIIGSLGYSYRPIIKDVFLDNLFTIYDSIFITSRNGFFCAFPFVLIGANIAFVEKRRSVNLSLIYTIIFSLLYVLEAFFIKNKLSTNVDMGVFLLPAIYFMIETLINLNIEFKPIFIRLRNLSMIIFVSQRLFITAIPSLFYPKGKIYIIDGAYVDLLIYLFCVLSFSILIEVYSSKYRSLKILW